MSAKDFLGRIGKELQKDTFSIDVVDSDDVSLVYEYSPFKKYTKKDFEKLLGKNYQNEIDTAYIYPMEGDVWEQALAEYKQKKYKELSATFDAHFIGSKIVLYRCISVKNIDDFLKVLNESKTIKGYKGIGVYWTWDKDTAEYFCEENIAQGNIIVLKALVDLNHIDYKTTAELLLQPLLGEKENEIRLLKGKPVAIVDVESSGKSIWQGQQTVKASLQPNHTLINSLQVLAGIQDTEYPYYHVSDHFETPTIRSANEGHKDPAGIYFFYKGKYVAQGDWKSKKYRWDAKIKANIVDINDLDYDDLLAKAGIKNVYQYVNSLQDAKTMDLERWKELDYQPWLDNDEEQFVWTDVGFPLLREHFNDQKKFAKFFLDQGIKALQDTEGHTVFFGEPQVIVLDPSIIEWGPREENVADNKVYIMSALQASLKPRPNRTLIAALKRVVADYGKLKWKDLDVDSWIEATGRSASDWAEQYGIDEDDLYEHFDEWYKGVEYGDTPSILYRAVCLDSIESLDQQNLGIHWASEISGAECYQAPFKGKFKYILKAKFPGKDYVDWVRKAAVNLDPSWDEEYEWTLLEGTKIEVLDIQDSKEGWLDISFKGTI